MATSQSSNEREIIEFLRDQKNGSHPVNVQDAQVAATVRELVESYADHQLTGEAERLVANLIQCSAMWSEAYGQVVTAKALKTDDSELERDLLDS